MEIPLFKTASAPSIDGLRNVNGAARLASPGFICKSSISCSEMFLDPAFDLTDFRSRSSWASILAAAVIFYQIISPMRDKRLIE